MATINPAPYTILNRRVMFGTVNSTNGTTIPEPFRVFGPYAQGVRITRLRTGDKAVIPLTSETGEGSFFLKLHFPNTGVANPLIDRALYVTFCVKNSTYDDGYKDFHQRYSPQYAIALRKWIDNGRAPSTSGVIRYRKLSFTAFGEETAQVNNAVAFEIRFNYRGANIGVNTNVNNTVGPNGGTATTGTGTGTSGTGANSTNGTNVNTAR